MAVQFNVELMQSIEQRYQSISGLASRDHYSIFYGPLRPSSLLVLNANPGGSPGDYKVVDVMKGEHEYIEGRQSGPTTAKGAEILQHIVGSCRTEDIRGIQVFNRFFRRSRSRPSARLESEYMAEARPYLQELIAFVKPEAILFGGDAGVDRFARAHGGQAKGDIPLMGPNGTHDAVYFRKYELRLPYYKPINAYGIYHPSKLNSTFRQKVFPLLRSELGHLTSRITG